MRQTISLERNTYTLKFDKVPDDGTLTVKDSDGKAVNGSNGVYTVISGTYTYTVTGAFGFEDKTDGSVEVIYTDRIYYINFVMQFRYGAGSEYKRFRLVVTRNGILSIEEMN